MSADDGTDAMDVYGLDSAKLPVKWVAGRDEDRKETHCVLPSPEDRYV